MVELNVDPSRVTNTIIQFRVDVETKLRYIALDDNKKKFVKQALVKLIKQLSTTESSELMEVRTVYIDIHAKEEAETEDITKELELKARKLRLCEEELSITREELDQVNQRLTRLEEVRKKYEHVKSLINLYKQKSIDINTLLSELLKL